MPEALTAETWPIAAAMINFPGVRRDGSRVQDDTAEGWSRTVGKVALAGFDHLDPTDSWLRVADLTPERRAEFADVLADAGLGVVCLSTARRSVIDPADGEENLAYSHRVIDAAAELGARVVSFGLFRPLTPDQARALWFWTVQGPVDDPSDESFRLAADRLRELGEHAASVGLDVSLEMYEDTLIGTSAGAVRLVTEIGLPNVGLNPDLANILRLHRPVEDWRDMADAVLPHTNFWHVKGYARIEDGTTGAASSVPTTMETGTIDYRALIGQAVDAGFRGPFLCEHYGGDGLSVSATNRDYVRRILATLPLGGGS